MADVRVVTCPHCSFEFSYDEDDQEDSNRALQLGATHMAFDCAEAPDETKSLAFAMLSGREP